MTAPHLPAQPGVVQRLAATPRAERAIAIFSAGVRRWRDVLAVVGRREQVNRGEQESSAV